MKHRLTDNQRRALSEILKAYDKYFLNLVSSVEESKNIKSVSGRLSTNLDFKNKAISSLSKVREKCIKDGVYVPILEEAIKECTSYLDCIIPGQPRVDVKQNIHTARHVFFRIMSEDSVNVYYSIYK